MNDDTDAPFSSQLYEQIARISKALASPRRLHLVDLLAQGERSVEALARETTMSVANTSRHLQELRAARLVQVRRQGLYAFYRVADVGVIRAWRAIRDLAHERLGDMDRLLRDRLGPLSRENGMSAEEALAAQREGRLVLIDARPEREYEAGHVAGAVSVPADENDLSLHVLPMDQPIVVYCRGPYSLLSDRVVERLRARG
jgi:DNA-binding transcriptional ArsR family regulator